MKANKSLHRTVFQFAAAHSKTACGSGVMQYMGSQLIDVLNNAQPIARDSHVQYQLKVVPLFVYSAL
ncbi:hypothetical protein A1356_17290 [Methylomonas koyamae]|uniref:Uncharacterized protein n=1 Tax=Methylomonas koyamae TaxID=702114 RepID=A0AA91I464_9GAMM|nr:hypothetical protein A1356_17290 [Methylomonas koyamae]